MCEKEVERVQSVQLTLKGLLGQEHSLCVRMWSLYPIQSYSLLVY